MTSLVVTRRGLSPPALYPASLRLTLASFGVERRDGIRCARLAVPRGWKVESPSPLAWFVYPDLGTLNVDVPAFVRLELLYDDGSRSQFARSVAVELDLQTTFSPDPHAYPERNSARTIPRHLCAAPRRAG
jgi:hypothetical protein